MVRKLQMSKGNCRFGRRFQIFASPQTRLLQALSHNLLLLSLGRTPKAQLFLTPLTKITFFITCFDLVGRAPSEPGFGPWGLLRHPWGFRGSSVGVPRPLLGRLLINKIRGHRQGRPETLEKINLDGQGLPPQRILAITPIAQCAR